MFISPWGTFAYQVMPFGLKMLEPHLSRPCNIAFMTYHTLSLLTSMISRLVWSLEHNIFTIFTPFFFDVTSITFILIHSNVSFVFLRSSARLHCVERQYHSWPLESSSHSRIATSPYLAPITKPSRQIQLPSQVYTSLCNHRAWVSQTPSLHHSICLGWRCSRVFWCPKTCSHLRTLD